MTRLLIRYVFRN